MWPFDDAVAALNGLYDFIGNLVMLVMYAPLRVLESVFNGIVNELNIIISFMDSIINILNFIIGDVQGLFSNVFPDSFVSYILIAELTVIGAYRIYHFVKDVEILGNKI